MRRLFLLRHAKSSWSDERLSDWERPLNHRGQTDAPRMALRMKEFFSTPEFIVCSDARRTQETLRYFLPILEMDSAHYVLEHRIYEADVRTLISLVESIPDAYENVMLIGHNPGLSLLTAYYTGEFVDMPTCAWTEMEFNVDSWSALSRDTGILRSFEYPKKDV